MKLWGSVTDMMFAFVLVWNMMEYDRHVQFIHHILLVLILSRPKHFWIFVYLYYVNTLDHDPYARLLDTSHDTGQPSDRALDVVTSSQFLVLKVGLDYCCSYMPK